MRAVLLTLILTISCFPAFAEDDLCKGKEGAEKECCDSCVLDGYKDGRSKLTDNGIGECNKEEDLKSDLCCCSPKK